MKTTRKHRSIKLRKTIKNRKYIIHIPKVIVQTSKNRPPQYIIDTLMNRCKGWKYEHYTDGQISKFFHDNYIHEFKDIYKKFKDIPTGAHKADLFRYYYIYVNGGVYLDTDAMLERDIDTIVKDNSFITVNSITTNTIFQGLLGAVPKNIIVYRALKHAYTINLVKLSKDYHLLTRNLYDIINNNNYDFKYKIYEEKIKNIKTSLYATSYNGKEKVVTHYFRDKGYKHWDLDN